MVVNHKVTGKALSIPAGIGLGVSASVVLTILGTTMTAWLVDGGYLQETTIGYSAMLVLLLSAMFGSWTASAVVRRRRFQVSLGTGGIYLLLLMGLTAFCFGGQYQGVVPTALLVIGGSAASVLLGNLGQGNRTSKRHKYRTG